MIKNLIKLFLCFTISFSFAQDTKYINVKIDGLHCASGCARYVQTELNKNEGIIALVDFNNKQAIIEYDLNTYSDQQIVSMINSYQGGKKYKASLVKKEAENKDSSACTKGPQCCKKTGKFNSACDNKSKGCCSSAKCSKKK